MGARFDARGMDSILANMSGLEAGMARASKAAMEEGAKVILERAKEYASMGGAHPNVITGTLLGALTIGRRKSTKTSTSVEIGVFGRSAPYAHLVEFGHGIHHSASSALPHPFLEPAFEEKQGEAIATITEAMKGAVKGQ